MSVIDLVAGLPDIVRLDRPNQKSDWMLFDARLPVPEGRIVLFTLVILRQSVQLSTTNADEISLSSVVRKPTFCICKNKGADQRLYFCYMDSMIPVLS